MAFQVTQCPSCESTFNTNPNLLLMAEGKVRCGACLTVFLAEENFIEANIDESEDEQESVFIGGQPADFFDPSLFLTRSALSEESHESQDELPKESVEEEHESLPATATQESSPRSEEVEISNAESRSEEHEQFFAAINEGLRQFDESADITELQEIAGLDPHDAEEQDHFDPFAGDEDDIVPDADKTQIEIPAAEEQASSSPASPDMASRPEDFSLKASFAMRIDTANSKPEETHEEENIQDDSTQVLVDALPASEPGEMDGLEAQVREAIEEQDFSAAVEAGLRAEPSLPAEAGTPATEAMAQDDQDTEVFEIGELEPSDAPREKTEAPADESPVDTSTAAIRARALQQELEDEEALEQIPRENLSTLKQIATPVQLLGGHQRSIGKRLAMLALILLFAATLATQFFWRYRDTYSLDPRFRAAYELVCAQLDCQLPEYSAIDEIRSDNLAVRSHPDREDGLIVTVEIRNTAEFQQRFPILILGFNSASNQVIALREFAPEEYLDEGLQQFEFMPVASPVQLTIPIMDPGNDAVNYTLAFRTP